MQEGNKTAESFKCKENSEEKLVLPFTYLNDKTIYPKGSDIHYRYGNGFQGTF